MEIQNLNIEPYYDDFNEEKGYHKILFRPGYAVQARELSQIQSILQNQIERFGKHIFKEGSMVLGGQTVYENENVFYLKLNDTNTLNNTVDVSRFVGKFIKKTGTDTIRAYVVAAEESNETEPKTLIIKYFSTNIFSASDNIEDEGGEFFATIASSGHSGNASVLSINEGVFFVNGFFVRVDPQTLILEKYSTTPSYRVGLEILEEIVSSNSDTSLLDPALYASNFQAPGANRLKISLTLTKRSLTSQDDSRFVDLIRIELGIIKQKVLYPQYSVIEDTLARRTYDESGDYTVRPFIISFDDDKLTDDSSKYNMILSPGKAYVKGYEFETISPTVLVADRARDFSSAYNYGLTFNYQYYVDTYNLNGTIDLKELTTINVHCVNTASLNTSSNSLLSATRIGSCRIRALDYLYGANTTSTYNATYRTYIFDTDIGNITSNAAGGTANTITLNSSSALQNDAYKGVKIRVYSNNGVNLSETKIINSYNGSSKVASFDSTWQFGIPNANTLYSLDFEFKDSESFIKTNTTNAILTSMDISNDSKYSILTDDYEGVFVSDQNYNSLLIRFPNLAIKEGSVTENEYYGRKVFTDTFDGTGKLEFTTPTGVTSAVNGSLSSTDSMDNFFVVLTSAGGTIGNRSIINFLNTSNTVSVVTSSNASTVTINSPGAADATASVYMKVKLPFPETVGAIRKTKTQRLSNVSVVSTNTPDAIYTGITLFNEEVDQPGLQLNVEKANTANLTNPSLSQSLFVADVIRIRGVYDFGNNAITQANLVSAVNLTTSFSLNTGQTDGAYDYSSISLRSGKNGPTGNVVIFADYYSHSGTGYHTVDSYVNGGTLYKNIPSYISPNSGTLYKLRDCIDFRPKRKNGSAGLNGSYDETVLGISGTSFETNYSYYLPRIDKVAISKDKKIEIIRGVSSMAPKPPADRSDAMTIYMLILPAYIGDTNEIRARFVENKRYTMRDIGEIEQRVQNLEYYSTLNFLEKVAADEQFIDDASGLPRVKTGIVVDPFTGFKIADVVNEDYSAAVDKSKGTVRPSFYNRQYRFEIDPNSTGYNANTHMITPEYTSTVFITQPMASSNVSVNPFNAQQPEGDTIVDAIDSQYPDIEQPPEVVDNIDGTNDNWLKCCNKWFDAQKNGLLGDLLDEFTSKTKADETTGQLDRLHEDRHFGFNCFKHEWHIWLDRYKKYGDQSYTLPVPSSIEISRDHILRNQGTYTAEDVDKNGDGYISQNEFDSFYENWLNSREKK